MHYEHNYKNDDEDGKQVNYDENGQLESEENWKDDISAYYIIKKDGVHKRCYKKYKSE